MDARKFKKMQTSPAETTGMRSAAWIAAAFRKERWVEDAHVMADHARFISLPAVADAELCLRAVVCSGAGVTIEEIDYEPHLAWLEAQMARG